MVVGRVFVLILTYKRLHKLRALVDNPFFWRDIDQCFVLNQGGKDETWKWLQLYASRNSQKPLSMRFSYQNRMAIGGRLRMIDYLVGYGLKRDDIVITLDDDVMPFSPNWAKWLTDEFGNPSVGAVGVQGFNVQDWDAIYPFVLVEPGDTCDVVNSGMTAYRGAVFLRGAEYDQEYYPFWHCDSDLAMQIRKLGYTCKMASKVGLAHEPHNIKLTDLYFSRLQLFKDKWRGKGLVEAERGNINEPANN